jgi:hypothetical protein
MLDTASLLPWLSLFTLVAVLAIGFVMLARARKARRRSGEAGRFEGPGMRNMDDPA